MAFENKTAFDFLWKALKIDPQEIERSMLGVVQSIEIMKKFMISVDERLERQEKQLRNIETVLVRLESLQKPIPLISSPNQQEGMPNGQYRE